MFYSQDHRERVQQQNPGASFGELGEILGRQRPWSCDRRR
ncbi:hypothetical protein ACWCZ5_32760 [Streptomyces sp. NPDC001667]